ncbi:MAG: isoamylase early set domain-containing protein [Salinibacter sp.]|jgi:hypothetical protein|uniref:isoamylase early set domain-containing protein n=1 Tax=Salinibacter sp. TaxID=2065818 RepID=UPI002FC30D49
MKNRDPDVIVRRFIDGDLPDEDVQAALHHIADDPEARSLLQFELRMTQDLAASQAPQPASDFAARTVEQLDEAEAPAPSVADRLHDWWTAVTRPLVTIPVRPVHAVAALALVVAIGWLAWPSGPAGPVPPSSPSPSASVQSAAAGPSQDGTVWTRFVYTSAMADSVAVAGDFSQWEPIPLSPRTVDGETVWTGLVPVSRGEHEYQFVIDGERWVTDPLAPVQQEDGFGAKNAVLKL